MSDRTKASVEGRSTADQPPAAARPVLGPTRIALGDFVGIAVQVGLVLGAAVLFRLELERGFATLAAVIFGGFLIHSWLPARLRMAFFVLLAMTALALLLGWDAVWVAALGLGLLGLCHLPVAWGARVALVVAVGAALAAVQAGAWPAPWGQEVVPILGAMLMFRLVLYLYDLKTDRTPAGLWPRIAYFFLLPNVSFPLFPVVDYKTFLRTYYDAAATEIYQKGVLWMLRGVSHLLLYRLVYHLLPRADASLEGVLGAYVYMAMTYGLYLRVSGLFHLIVGSLCLFGFNLPPASHYYFLSSSFNDLWRRMNIYWKDFMIATVFYPVFLKVRRGGKSQRLVLAVAAVIVVTWFLHAYQWFWLQGVFPVTKVDIVFWGFLGVMLAINTLGEGRRRKRRRGPRAWSWKGALGVSLRTLGIFSTMAVLWTLWSEGSFSAWAYRLLQVRESGAREWALFGTLLAVTLAIGTGAQWLAARDWGLARIERIVWRRAPLLVPAGAAALLLLVQPAIHGRLGPQAARAVSKARSTGLNQIDQKRQERGYYETLSRANQLGPTPDWALPELGDRVGVGESPMTHRTGDARGYTLIPDVDVELQGVAYRTNRWGLRDRDYTREKPPGVYRFVLLGASVELGNGVRGEQTFENVLEDRLNRDLAGHGYDRYEILNFAVGGYGLLQTLFVAERSVGPFRPDAAVYIVHPGETTRLVERLRMVLDLGARLDGYGPVERALAASGARAGLPAEEFTRRMDPYDEELVTWSYRRKAASLRRQGIRPVFVFLPMPGRDFERDELRWLTGLAREAGAAVLVMNGVFDGYDLEEIQVAKWDNHPNPLGHRLIADRLYEAFLAHAEVLGLQAGGEASFP